MEKVLNQAELLAEAILESEEYINMRLTEQAVMKDEEATLLVANYSEKRSKVEELLANPNLDRGELAKAGQALQDQPRMTAATERGVDVLALQIRDERIDRLVQQDRGV